MSGPVVGVYEIVIQKQFGTEYYTNVWHCLVDGISAAKAVANAIFPFERGIHLAAVELTSYRVRLAVKGAQGTIVPINLPGQISNQSYMPLFNIIRVDFEAGEGRPSRKYFRTPVPVAVQSNGLLSPTFVSDTTANFQALLDSPQGQFICDVDGQQLLTAKVNQYVGMRQLRRGSKRRLQPIIPVS